MKNFMKSIVVAIAVLLLTGCGPDTNKEQQSKLAQAAAESITFTENSEIDNIKRRLELTSKVNLGGYVVLLNDAGQPIMYLVVKGKITSGSKRLTREDERIGEGGTRKAASDEGSFGSSAPYIFFWDTKGTYYQWSGQYLYSTQPIRLRVEPLVVDVK